MSETTDADLPHVDEVAEIPWSDRFDAPDVAVDDGGRRYAVRWNSWAMQPTLHPQMTEEELRAREGAEEPCEGCGHTIAFDAIVVNDKRGETMRHYHVNCYVAAQK